jgi:hypothetical protein
MKDGHGWTSAPRMTVGSSPDRKEMGREKRRRGGGVPYGLWSGGKEGGAWSCMEGSVPTVPMLELLLVAYTKKKEKGERRKGREKKKKKKKKRKKWKKERNSNLEILGSKIKDNFYNWSKNYFSKKYA